MSERLEGKAAIVTGGSRGIGRAIAIGLAAQGAAVAVGYVANEERARETVDAIVDAGGRAIGVKADLSVLSEITMLFDKAEDASVRSTSWWPTLRTRS